MRLHLVAASRLLDNLYFENDSPPQREAGPGGSLARRPATTPDPSLPRRGIVFMDSSCLSADGPERVLRMADAFE